MISVVISTNNSQEDTLLKNLEVLLDIPIVDDIHICHHNFHQYFRIDHERIYEWTKDPEPKKEVRVNAKIRNNSKLSL